LRPQIDGAVQDAGGLSLAGGTPHDICCGRCTFCGW
jgi:hypothetical protein